MRQLIVALLIALSLIGCTHKKVNDFPLSAKDSAIQELQAGRVQIIEVGETVKLVISSDLLFMKDSANFNPKYVDVFQRIVELIENYDATLIKVAAYTDSNSLGTYQDALSNEQARVVAKRLWNRGLPTRLLYEKGYGMKYAVASNQTTVGRCMNRRVEISFNFRPPRDYVD